MVILSGNNKVENVDYRFKSPSPSPESPVYEKKPPAEKSSKSFQGDHESTVSRLEQQNNKNNAFNLESHRIQKLQFFFDRSSMFARSIQDYFQGKVRGKLDSDRDLYDSAIYFFMCFFSFRYLALAFIETYEYRVWLGEVERVRPHRQLAMVFTIWSLYFVYIFKGFTAAYLKKAPLTWLEPFQLLRGESIPSSHGFSKEMLASWYNFTLSSFRYYFGYALAGVFILTTFIAGMLRHRWNSYEDKSNLAWFNSMQLIWSLLQMLWISIGVFHTMVCFIYFNTLCSYFTLRYEKVNQDIEYIIGQRLKANERVALLHHILVEHNTLCLKVAEYNKFWARYLMCTYFFLVSVICFTSFQAFFTSNLVIVRLIMFISALVAAYIITRMSVSAAVMSNMAHAPYNRLIRVTFEKYPVELQIQLRMFIQRTSGPTIGFYCLDVFEITYTTYASILAALGQNFLLIVDFVRSYAEVGKEYEEIAFSQFDMLTQSVLNSTLDVLDEMTGTHISSSITSGNLTNLV